MNTSTGVCESQQQQRRGRTDTCIVEDDVAPWKKDCNTGTVPISGASCAVDKTNFAAKECKSMTTASPGMRKSSNSTVRKELSQRTFLVQPDLVLSYEDIRLDKLSTLTTSCASLSFSSSLPDSGCMFSRNSNRNRAYSFDGIDMISLGAMESHFPSLFEEELYAAKNATEKMLLKLRKSLDDEGGGGGGKNSTCGGGAQEVSGAVDGVALGEGGVAPHAAAERVRQSLLRYSEYNILSGPNRASTMIMEGIVGCGEYDEHYWEYNEIDDATRSNSKTGEVVNPEAGVVSVMITSQCQRWAVDIPYIFIPSASLGGNKRAGDAATVLVEERYQDGKNFSQQTRMSSEKSEFCDGSKNKARKRQHSMKNGMFLSRCRHEMEILERRQRHIDQLTLLMRKSGELLQQRRFREAIVMMQDMIEYHRAERGKRLSFTGLDEKPSSLTISNTDVQDTYAENDDDHIIGSLLHNIGNVYLWQGRYSHAANYYRTALRVRSRSLGSGNPDIAVTLNKLGMTLYALGDFSEAESSFRDALELRRKLLDRDHSELGKICNNLGCVHFELGNYAVALKWFGRALDAQRAGLMELSDGDSTGLNAAISLSNTSIIYAKSVEFNEARKAIEEAYSIQQTVLEGAHEINLPYVESIAFASSRTGDYSKAAEAYEALLLLHQGVSGINHIMTAKALVQLSHAYLKSGHHDDAIGCLKRLLDIQEKRLVSNDPKLRNTRKSVQMLEKLCRPKERRINLLGLSL